MIRHLITTFPATTVFALCCVLTAAPAMAQLRIVTYNSATDTTPGGADVPRAGMASVLEGLGIESRNGIQRPVDILAVQEVKTGLNGAQQLMNQLNSIYGAGTYARSMLPGASTDGTTEAVIYNTNTVQLVGQQDIGVASTSGSLAAPIRFEFHPVGYDSNANFYLYDSHYKAGSAGSDQSRRSIEASAIRGDADALGAEHESDFSGGL